MDRFSNIFICFAKALDNINENGLYKTNLVEIENKYSREYATILFDLVKDGRDETIINFEADYNIGRIIRNYPLGESEIKELYIIKDIIFIIRNLDAENLLVYSRYFTSAETYEKMFEIVKPYLEPINWEDENILKTP